MFDLELRAEHGQQMNSEGEQGQYVEPDNVGLSVKAQRRQHDLELVQRYKQAVARYGERSEEAGVAFEPIFEQFWPQIQYLANSKIGAVYADDLASETLKTVWERLNGREVINNLNGLVRHSFDREYATLLEKLFQGRRLARQHPTENELENTSGEAVSPPRIKGVAALSLNSPVGGESDDLELIQTLADPDSDVEDAASRRELIAMLRGLISQMPAQYRGPLVCQWLLGMRIKEVAGELNMTLDQVKHNTRRGLDWLAKQMPGQTADWL